MIDVKYINKAIKIIDNLTIMTFDEEKTKQMLEAVKKEDYALAIQCLEEGAAPNAGIFNGFEERVENVISILLSNSQESEKLTNFSEFPDRYDEDDEDRFEKASYADYKLVKNLLEKWKEKGGSFNAKTVSFSEENKGLKSQTVRDVVFSTFFLEDGYTSSNDRIYFYYTANQIDFLKEIAGVVSEKIEPLYAGRPILSFVFKEAWTSHYTFMYFLNLLNTENENLLVNKETGGTVLHTKLDIKNNEANYYKGRCENVNYKELIDNYSNLIKVLPPELLLVKDKKGDLPYQFFAENKCWPQFIATINVMKENKYEINLTDKIIDLFPDDLKDLNIISSAFTKETCVDLFKEIISLKEKKLLEKSFEEVNKPKKINRI